MSVLKYFKNIPRSLPIGRQGLSVISFLQICNEIPGKKRGLSPPNGRQGACRPPSGDHWAQPTGAAGGPVAPPGDRGIPVI